jgi:hypothetical protein
MARWSYYFRLKEDMESLSEKLKAKEVAATA